MEHFDAAIIGFGTAGRALGEALADAGKSVAVIERSDAMYGGACVNVACIPTKALVHAARLSAEAGGSIEQHEERYTAAVDDTNRLRTASRERAYRSLADRPNARIIDGTAAFAGPHRLSVAMSAETLDLEAELVFVDTGSVPSVPDIPGIDSPRVYTSDQLIDVRVLPRQLVIVGAGYVGLEFASLYADFGAQVTVLQRGPAILPDENPETAQAVRESLEARGIEILCNADVRRIDDESVQVLVMALVDGEEKRLPAHGVLVATGRVPNTADLGLQAAGIHTDERGGITVDEHLRTSAPNVWALGDATGGPQFTYLAYDDYRIVASDVLGDGQRTTENRGAVPRCTFVHPPFARIGASTEEAREAGFSVQTFTLLASGISQARILQDETGLIKAVVDANSQLLLGMDLFCEDAQELVNLVKIVMDARIPVSVLRDAVFSHPSMSEAFNNLFSQQPSRA